MRSNQLAPLTSDAATFVRLQSNRGAKLENRNSKIAPSFESRVSVFEFRVSSFEFRLVTALALPLGAGNQARDGRPHSVGCVVDGGARHHDIRSGLGRPRDGLFVNAAVHFHFAFQAALDQRAAPGGSSA